MLDTAPFSWVFVWEVPLGNDSRLEGSHLRCTGPPAASSASAFPESRADGGGERGDGNGDGEWDMKVEVVQRDGGADAEECLFLPLFRGQKKTKKKHAAGEICFSHPPPLSFFFSNASFSSTARFTVFGLLPSFLSTNTK